MNAKIEQMAKAIGDHIYGYVDKIDTPHTWPKCIGIARVAISAMRDGWRYVPNGVISEEQCNEFINKLLKE
jgi:hypothetical protein